MMRVSSRYGDVYRREVLGLRPLWLDALVVGLIALLVGAVGGVLVVGVLLLAGWEPPVVASLIGLAFGTSGALLLRLRWSEVDRDAAIYRLNNLQSNFEDLERKLRENGTIQ